jgi:hypothetical protein
MLQPYPQSQENGINSKLDLSNDNLFYFPEPTKHKTINSTPPDLIEVGI